MLRACSKIMGAVGFAVRSFYRIYSVLRTANPKDSSVAGAPCKARTYFRLYYYFAYSKMSSLLLYSKMSKNSEYILFNKVCYKKNKKKEESFEIPLIIFNSMRVLLYFFFALSDKKNLLSLSKTMACLNSYFFKINNSTTK